MSEAIPPESPTTRRSASLAELVKALAKARAELPTILKDRQNPHLKNWYADLAAVIAAVTPALLKHGLVVVQMPCELGDGPALSSLLAHTSGEWVETVIKLRPTKPDPQAVGSALTYARRYALQSLCGVTAEDDDANVASRPHTQQAPAPPPNRDAVTQAHRVTAGRLVARAAAAKEGQELDAVARDTVGLPPELFGTVKAAVEKRRKELSAAKQPSQQPLPGTAAGAYGG